MSSIQFVFWLGIALLIEYSMRTDANQRKYESDHENSFKRPYWTNKFREVGNAAGTDKTSGFHHYENFYGKYFAHDSYHLHGRTIKILEIGLGCNMGYGRFSTISLL